jgi:hypothetical protein
MAIDLRSDFAAPGDTAIPQPRGRNRPAAAESSALRNFPGPEKNPAYSVGLLAANTVTGMAR